jgi:hypothetical protein
MLQSDNNKYVTIRITAKAYPLITKKNLPDFRLFGLSDFPTFFPILHT